MFSAINANYVTVAITAPVEDMLEQTVEVKNGAGVVVPVKPLDIAAGDETAEFEFVTAVKVADLVGVWTVDGVEYDLDLFNKLSDFLVAANQLDLNAALVALEIENVDSTNMPTYLTEKNKLTVTAEELTVDDVQKLVDDVNAAAIGEEEEAVLVEAIVDAVTANNQVTTLQALQNAGIAPLNNDWMTEYMEGTATPTSGLDTMTTANDLDDVQGIINTLNDELVAANITTTGIDRDDLNDSKALIEAYATVNEDGDYVRVQFDTDIEDINVQIALIDVLEATTPTAFKNKLTALETLVDNPAVLDMDDYIDVNGKAYIDALDATLDANKDTVAKVKAILFGAGTGVNDLEEGALITAVTTAADAEALVAALNDLGIKQVVATNEDAYFAFDSGVDGADYANNVVTKADAQALVDGTNVDEVVNATASTIIEKLNVFGTDNVVAANAEAYVTDANITGLTAGVDNDATVLAVETALDAANKAVVVAAQVEAINEAEDVATIKGALDILADVDEVADYLKIRSVDRDFVAAYVLENRPVAPGYASLAAIDAEVTNAQGAHAAALTAVNAIQVDTSIDTIVTALEGTLDEAYNDLSNTAKVTVAEDFYAQLTFKADGKLETPFVTLAAVKGLL